MREAFGTPYVPFSSLTLIAVLASKPLWDAAYFIPIAKYAFMLLVLGTALLEHTARRLSLTPSLLGSHSQSTSAQTLTLLWISASYFGYLVAIATLLGGGLHESFKIVSPFVLYLLLRNIVGPSLRAAAIASAGVVIVGNGFLLLFDYGWVQWGTVRTFKGFYYFKTDLAFSLVTSLLLLSVALRFKITPLLGVVWLLAGLQVLLANSRLNYLLFVMLFMFVLTQQRLNMRHVVGTIALVTAASGIVYAIYDPSRFLSLSDWSDLGRFLQGRNVIWDVLISRGIGELSISGWLFGRGLYYDYEIVNEVAFGLRFATNAHNEGVHLLLTQGLIGAVMYVSIWLFFVRDSIAQVRSRQCRFSVYVALGMLGIQSLTAVTSSFATKTWPIVFVLLLVKAMRASDEETTPAQPIVRSGNS